MDRPESDRSRAASVPLGYPPAEGSVRRGWLAVIGPRMLLYLTLGKRYRVLFELFAIEQYRNAPGQKQEDDEPDDPCQNG